MSTGNVSQPADGDLVLSLDIGSSSVRANLFDTRARRLAELETQINYATTRTVDGGAEIAPDLLLKSLCDAIDGTLEKAGDIVRNIRAVGACSLVSNVMGVNQAGEPTTPIYTWADTRNTAEAQELKAHLSEEEVHERTGCHIHTSYLPARLLWLKRRQAEAYGRTDKLLAFGDWLYMKLFGQTGESLSVASWGGLLNRHTLDWDDQLLALLDVSRRRLPELVDVGDQLQGLRPEYASRWTVLANIPWLPCVGDGTASNIGSGCSTPDAIGMQSGTSGAMRVMLPDWNHQAQTAPSASAIRIPMGLWCYRLDRGTALLGGALSEGGNIFAWLRGILNVQDVVGLERAAEQMQPDAHGLTVLPFLAGERSPGWRGDARGLLAGLTLDTEPAHLLRAFQEAIAYRFGLVFDLMATVLPPPRLIVASGGALLKTPGWMSMIADVLGQPVTASAEEEASSKGVATIVLRALGMISDFSDVPPALGAVFQPDPDRHVIYRAAMERQRTMYERQ